jgi:hypothetical protein
MGQIISYRKLSNRKIVLGQPLVSAVLEAFKASNLTMIGNIQLEREGNRTIIGLIDPSVRFRGQRIIIPTFGAMKEESFLEWVGCEHNKFQYDEFQYEIYGAHIADIVTDEYFLPHVQFRNLKPYYAKVYESKLYIPVYER